MVSEAQFDLILVTLKDIVRSLNLNLFGIFGLGIFLLLSPTGKKLGYLFDNSNNLVGRRKIVVLPILES